MIISLEECINLDILVEVIVTTFLSSVYSNSDDESQRQRVLECIHAYYPTPHDRYRVGINIKSIPNERMLMSHGLSCGLTNKVTDIIVDSIVWNKLLVSNEELITIDLCVVLHDMSLMNAGWVDAVIKAKCIVKTNYIKALLEDLNVRT